MKKLLSFFFAFVGIGLVIVSVRILVPRGIEVLAQALIQAGEFLNRMYAENPVSAGAAALLAGALCIVISWFLWGPSGRKEITM